MENPRAYEQLVKRVEELEKQIKERPNKDDAMRDLRKDLLNYDDKIRNEKDITLKKNFVIRNRKGEIPGHENENDNSITLFFNQSKPARLNHIFLGDNSVKGDFRNNCLAGRVVYKKDAPDIFNNGAIQFMLIREENLNLDGTAKSEGLFPQISIHPIEAYGVGLKNGEVASVIGTGENGYARLLYLNQAGVVVNKDGVYLVGIPASDPGIPGLLYHTAGTLKISL